MESENTYFNMEENYYETEEKSNEAIRIQISYSDPEELEKLHDSPEFISYIHSKVLDKIEYAINNNLKRIEVFNIINMALIIELKKENYSKILENINNSYLESEDFETCHKIQNLISKL